MTVPFVNHEEIGVRGIRTMERDFYADAWLDELRWRLGRVFFVFFFKKEGFLFEKGLLLRGGAGARGVALAQNSCAQVVAQEERSGERNYCLHCIQQRGRDAANHGS